MFAGRWTCAAGSGIAWSAPLISALIVIGYFGCIYMLFIEREDMPPSSFQLMKVMFGVLPLSFGQVCNHWLGSSAGSKRSGNTLHLIAEKRT